MVLNLLATSRIHLPAMRVLAAADWGRWGSSILMVRTASGGMAVGLHVLSRVVPSPTVSAPAPPESSALRRMEGLVA